MVSPVRYPSGVSTQAVGKSLGMFPMPDPTKTYTHFEDFPTYTAADWTVAVTSTGANAAAAGQGGVITQTTAIGATDYTTIASNPTAFNFVATQQVWFETRLTIDNVTIPTMLAGLVAGTIAAFTATPPTSGIWFYKAPAATAVTLITRVGSGTAISLSVPIDAALLVAGTNIRLGFYYNGKDAIDVFVNGNKVASQTTLTQLPVATALTPAVGVGSGAGGVAVQTVDYILAAQDRTAI